jgi:hypothetical protein
MSTESGIASVGKKPYQLAPVQVFPTLKTTPTVQKTASI